jgi:hypothetical protein
VKTGLAEVLVVFLEQSKSNLILASILSSSCPCSFSRDLKSRPLCQGSFLNELILIPPWKLYHAGLTWAS